MGILPIFLLLSFRIPLKMNFAAIMNIAKSAVGYVQESVQLIVRDASPSFRRMMTDGSAAKLIEQVRNEIEEEELTLRARLSTIKEIDYYLADDNVMADTILGF